MADLMVQIDGETVPLADCNWSMWAECGCMVAITMAVIDSLVLATAEQAHKDHSPRKRDRDRETRLGYRWELITTDRYRREIASNWKCEQHRTPAP